jgi:hexulose-6-phosphate isomerase
MTLRLAVKLGMLSTRESVPGALAQLAALGLDGVEVGTGVGDPVELAAAAVDAGIDLPTVIADGSFAHSATDPDPRERAAAASGVRRAVDMAAAVGAGVVMCCPGWDRPELRPEQTAELALDTLQPVSDEARRSGVRLAIENLWNGWLVAPMELGEFVDRLDAGVLFDTGNAARFWAPQHGIHSLGARIVRVDLKDFRRDRFAQPATVYGRDEELRAVWGPDGPWGALDVLPFDGDVDWPLVADALRDIGYDGWVCAEHGGGDVEWVKSIVARLRRFRDLVAGPSAERVPT